MRWKRKRPDHSGRFHVCSKWEVCFDTTDYASHVVGAQARDEVRSTFGASLSMQLVEALKADGINHVAFHP